MPDNTRRNIGKAVWTKRTKQHFQLVTALVVGIEAESYKKRGSVTP